MNILVISDSGDSLGIAAKWAESGSVNVRYYIRDSQYRYAGEGLVERVTNWREHVDWADFTIADMVGFSHYERTLRRRNARYVGFNKFGDALELDRAKQMEVFRKLNIKLPVTYSFPSPGDAADFSEMFPRNGVAVKPSGNIETAKTYLAKNVETFNWALEQYSASQELVIQELVNGVEISTEGWFTGTDFLPSLWSHTLEEKRLMDGGTGPNTGCMGNIVWRANPGSKLVKNVEKLKPILARIGYVGPCDLNAIANAQGINALELTMRLGYDAAEAQAILLSPAEQRKMLFSLANGTSIPQGYSQGRFATAVRIFVSPYPGSTPDISDRGLPVTVRKDVSHMFFPTDCYLENGSLKWAAGDGVIGKMVGVGKTVAESINAAYDNLKGVEVLGAGWRSDIGARADSDIKQLQEWELL